jgi:putative acetyltransferase
MIHYEHTDFSNPDFKHFCEELDREYVIRYPYMPKVFNPHNVMNIQARVIMAYDDAKPVACGAFRPLNDQTIEVKRMYTKPAYRNLGIGKQLLMGLEQWAKSEGYSESILETGIKQPEAIAAYEKSGYTRIPNYPPYEYVMESVCYHKEL